MRWGIMSTARIARAFVAALGASETEQALAVGSRDAARAAAFARDLGIPRAYGAYEQLLADPDVEAVYIGLPNRLHAEWSIRAAQAGKHVLCEKPLAVSRAEAEAMFTATRETRVVLLEAFMYRFHPRTLQVKELIDSGAIGQVRLIRAAFGFTVTDPANVRLSADLAGGALMDVGCYAVNFARMVAGCSPQYVDASARWAPSGVDETLTGALTYPDGPIAQIACSLASSHYHHAQVIGSEGGIEIDEAFTPPLDRPARLRIWRGARSAAYEEMEFPPLNQYRLEAEGFSRLVRDGHGAGPEMPLLETLDNLATIEALLRSAREGRHVEVES